MKKFLPIYLLILAGDLLSIAYFYKIGEYIFKPLLMISLGFYAYTELKNTAVPKSSGIFLLAALLFSFIGDVVLLYPNLFVFGLLSFLFAHICYIAVFRKDNTFSVLKQRDRYWAVISVLIYTMLFIMYLADKLGPMLVPVMIYSAIITVMLLTVLNRWKCVTPLSFRMVMIGAILFAFSDSTIAVNKFAMSFEGASFLIMSTYAIGQFLIVEGFLRNYKVH